MSHVRRVILVLCLCVFCAQGAYAQETPSIIWAAEAMVYDAPRTDAQAQGTLKRMQEIDVISMDEAWAKVQAGGMQGYVQVTEIALPTGDGEWDGFACGAMLCQTLTMRSAPAEDAPRVHTLDLDDGELFVLLDKREGWTLAGTVTGDGRYWVRGWIQSKYTVEGMGSLYAQEVLYPLAYPAEDAPCVGQLPVATRVNLIARLDAYYVISLRGASAFLPITAKVCFTEEAALAPVGE